MSIATCKHCELVIEGKVQNGNCPYCGEEASEMPEHDPSTTIVERIEMTPELKQAFENAGYEVEDEK